jgi:hypothetical protein
LGKTNGFAQLVFYLGMQHHIIESRGRIIEQTLKSQATSETPSLLAPWVGWHQIQILLLNPEKLEENPE